MAMRGVYEWFAGISPCLDGLEIAPCIPSDIPFVDVEFTYLGKIYTLHIASENSVILNGRQITQQRTHHITGKEVFFVPLSDL